jgi:signal transduction histidine kinase
VVAIADRMPTWWTDVAVAVVVAAVTGMDAWWNQPGTRQADALTYALVVMSVAAVLVRRRWPVAVTVVCACALTGWYLLGHRGELLQLPSMVGLYTVAVQGGRARAVVAAVAAVVWSGCLGWWTGDRASFPVAELVWPAVAVLVGEVVRGRRELHAEYAARRRRDTADREREAERRIGADRLRIAREVHDVVAHTMAAVNVQMGVAVAAFDQRPETARAALAEARESCRAALAELRAAVAVLRVPESGRPADPEPGLERLDDLVAWAGRTGVRVMLRLGGGELWVPAVVEVAAYRIVQEALTNVVRHASAATVTIAVIRTPAAVTVEVTDDGAASTVGTWSGPGLGLTGMTERAAALGGRVDYGPVPGVGFRVRAVLPVAGR